LNADRAMATHASPVAHLTNADAGEARRQRAVARALLAISATLAVLLFGFLWVRSAPTRIEVTMFAAAFLIPLAGIALIRLTGRIVAGLALITLAGLLLIGAWAWLTGGIVSMVLPWALALLALLSIFGNLALLAGAGALLTALLLLLYAATTWRWIPESLLPPELIPEMLLLSLSSSAALVVSAAALVLRERAAARERLRAAHHAALTANRAKSAFLASASHELRTPLAAVIGYAELLKLDPRESLSRNQLSHLEHILVAGDHLLALVNQMIDMGRIEAGDLDLHIEAVRVAEVVAAALAIVELPAGRRGIEIDNRTCGEATQFVRADATRLRQVLVNLVSNALKFNRDNGRVSVTAVRAGETVVRISVTDTGHGIAADRLAGIFDTYSSDGASPARAGGRGLGLAIAGALVAAMGGRVGADSVPGEGSTFWVELAAAD
jgi:signal transduction histidine kinase